MKLTSCIKVLGLVVVTLLFSMSKVSAGGTDPYGREDPNKKILKQGLLGAGVGAISAEASGGKAGTGALVGAGTNVIGGALLDTLTAPSQPQPAYYAQPQPVYQSAPVQQQGYVQQQPYYGDPQPQPVYYAPPPPQQDPTKRILTQGLLGAGTGAIAASASGGKAGTGALVGAGTNVIGGALLDYLTTPSQPQQPVYYQQQPQQQQPQSYYGSPQQKTTTTTPKKKIIRKYDAEGNVISEEEVYE